MNVGDGEVLPGKDLVSAYDYVSALLVQIHRHAAEGLAGMMTAEQALRLILEESVDPCPAKVTVLRGKDALIAELRELKQAL